MTLTERMRSFAIDKENKVEIESQAVKVSELNVELERKIRLNLMDEILDFIAEQAGGERSRVWGKLHKLRQGLVSKFGCNTTPNC